MHARPVLCNSLIVVSHSAAPKALPLSTAVLHYWHSFLNDASAEEPGEVANTLVCIQTLICFIQ